MNQGQRSSSGIYRFSRHDHRSIRIGIQSQAHIPDTERLQYLHITCGIPRSFVRRDITSSVQAAYPDKLYVGAVVQNCYGLGNVTCKTGVRVTGTNPDNGQPITAISDKSPDVNGIEEFCTDPKYVQYCNSGQIRVLYVNETESNGPCQARYGK